MNRPIVINKLSAQLEITSRTLRHLENEYTPDRLRLCLEEHIRNDNPNGQGGQFILNLLEPVKRK